MAKVCGFELLYMKDRKDEQGRPVGESGQLFLGDTLIGEVFLEADNPYQWMSFMLGSGEYNEVRGWIDLPEETAAALHAAVEATCGPVKGAPRNLAEVCTILVCESVAERSERYDWLTKRDRTGHMPTRTSFDDLVVECPAEVVEYREQQVAERGLMPEFPNKDDLEWLNGKFDEKKFGEAVDAIMMTGMVILDDPDREFFLNDYIMFDAEGVVDGKTAAEALAEHRPELAEWSSARFSRLVATEPFGEGPSNMFDVNTGAIVKVCEFVTQVEGWDTGSLGCRMILGRDGICNCFGPMLHDKADYLWSGCPHRLIDDAAVAMSSRIMSVLHEFGGPSQDHDDRF